MRLKRTAATGQAMVNETMDALDRLAKSGPAVTDMAAASTEFASEQAKAMPKHMAAFVDIAKTAQAEAMDDAVAGQAATAAVKMTRPQKQRWPPHLPPPTLTRRQR